ncbi:MAG: hypothetical protein BA872_08100 [Desulfobacterales bacterium C00003060]|nr:MAG: hypothetical protein BA861_04480 [Desulfobacterales bacterium S3730MH5]OEU77302.1 MAG: hypothetical protein BA872_08100 [Desulfobacterales bacterium C00003060]OEU80073.1 MAG: hypothetical protein BA865_08570 [Desulfobacterales bacterium S5133MH4]
MWSDIFSALKAMDFKRLNEILAGVDVLTLLKNPWVIAVTIIISVVLIIRHMEKTLVTLLSIPALLVIFQKTIQDTSSLEVSLQKLLIFVGGLVVIAAVNIYFHVVR